VGALGTLVIPEYEERIKRLERCTLALVALMTSEAQAVGTPEQVAALQQQFGDDLTAIAQGSAYATNT
jgi:hypothetical protein